MGSSEGLIREVLTKRFKTRFSLLEKELRQRKILDKDCDFVKRIRNVTSIPTAPSDFKWNFQAV